MTRPYCALGKLIPTTPDTERIKRDAWHQDGWLVVHKDDTRLDFVQREFVQQIGNLLHGKGTK
jgi:hypothetical protein